MKPADLDEEAVFNAARGMADPHQVRAYLEVACAGRTDLRRRVERLLEVAAQADAFFARHATAPDGSASGSQNPLPTDLAGSDAAKLMIGRYLLLEKIGEGGCGVVYVAEQQEPIRRQVALKIIKLGMNTRQVVARFEAERQALALMDHPNIAQVFDAGATQTGRPYFVMELVRGPKITEYCDCNRLSTRQRLEVFRQVCQAIQHAHQKGIIHRDIKPSNILVVVRDGLPIPKVIDFGIAKATASQPLTNKTPFNAAAHLAGTPAYMSPEQTLPNPWDVDTRTDIYSLGVLLYELLTGGPPVENADLLRLAWDDVRRIIRDEKPPRPSTRLKAMTAADARAAAQQRQADVPRLIGFLRDDLDWIAIKALEKDRSQRYATANALANDIERFLNCEPVTARPPSTAYRLRKVIQRHRLPFAAAGLLTAALVGGAAVSVRQALRAGRAEQAARHAESVAEASATGAGRNLYAANMVLVQQSWERNNLARVRKLLDETAAYLDRGFEWFYWQRQSHLELRTFYGQLGPVYTVAFSPDGRRIATGGGDATGTAKIWDAASGKEMLTLLGHKAPVRSLVFSPDGQRLATGSADHTAKVWDALTGQFLLNLPHHSGWVRAVAFSPDGKLILTGSADGTARLWNAITGQEILRFRAHRTTIRAVAFAPGGGKFATACAGGTAKIWDMNLLLRGPAVVQTGSADETVKIWEPPDALLTLAGHDREVTSVAFSPDGQRVATGSGDKSVKIWAADTGQPLLAFQDESEEIMALAFSPDSRRIVTGSGDAEVDGPRNGVARVWDANTGKELFILRGHTHTVSAVAFSPDGQLILTGSWDKTAKLWDASPKEPITFRGHHQAVTSAAVSPDGQRVVTGSDDRSARVWEAATGNELLALTGHNDTILCVAFSPDGQQIATGSWDKTVRLWDAWTGRQLCALTHDTGVLSVAFSPNGQRVISATWNGTVNVWDAWSGQRLLRIEGHHDPVRSAISPDGLFILTGSEDQSGKLWDANTGRELLSFLGHTKGIHAVAFSPDQQTVATGGRDGTARIWEAASGRLLLPLESDGADVRSLAFAPGGHRLAMGNRDHTIGVWDTSSGRQVLALLGHSEEINAVCFSPDGQHLISASKDRTARVWQTATRNQVAGWQLDQKLAAARVLVNEREQGSLAGQERLQRTQDPGAIKQWLVALPFARKKPGGAAALVQENIPGEPALRPRLHEPAADQKWQAVQVEDGLLDFNRLVGQPTDQSIAYALCYIQSDRTVTGLVLCVGSDDEAQVFLNGRELYRYTSERSYLPDEDKVNGITLQTGLNILLFKVANETGAWQGSIRLTTAEDRPVEGIRFSLDPTR